MISSPLSRLNTYNNTLFTYDFKDKHTTFNSFSKNSIVTDVYCSISGKIYSNLNEFLFNEFLMFKRMYLKSTKKHQQTTYFTITLRKKVLFLCIELLLNSSFISTKLKLLTKTTNFSTFNFKLNTLFNSNSFFNFTPIYENFNPCFNSVFQFDRNYNILFLQSYLFLPITF